MRNSSIGVLLLAGVVAGTTAALRPPVASGGGPPAAELTSTSWRNSAHPLRLAELGGRAVLAHLRVLTRRGRTATAPPHVAAARRSSPSRRGPRCAWWPRPGSASTLA